MTEELSPYLKFVTESSPEAVVNMILNGGGASCMSHSPWKPEDRFIELNEAILCNLADIPSILGKDWLCSFYKILPHIKVPYARQEFLRAVEKRGSPELAKSMVSKRKS